jgi:nicotinamide phosphoribosyltransferase
MKRNLILTSDSYKYSQSAVYPKGTEAMYSYIEARIKGETIVPLGLSMFIQDWLTTPITSEDINEAEALIVPHGEPFDRPMWEHILKEYNGYLPITIRGIPEGLPVKSSTAIVSVICHDPKCASIASFIETGLQRSIWYPTTIASQGLSLHKTMKYMYDTYSDNSGNLPFSLNDFGARGVTSYESAQIGGLGHLVYFSGTDNVPALVAAKKYYSAKGPIGYSVPASEHSVQCAYGKDNQREYLKTMLDTYAKPNGIVSIVLDGYDVYREANLLCTEFKEQIVNSGAKVVFRPDSGDMFEVVPRLLEMQEDAFGFRFNSKGKKVINNVGIIQGDGINPTTASMLMNRVVGLGYAPECVVLGSGGGLLQSVTRDTMSFAMKTSAIKINGEWKDVVKTPITSPGKASKGGIQDTEDFVTYYQNGTVMFKPSWVEVRKNALKYL